VRNTLSKINCTSCNQQSRIHLQADVKCACRRLANLRKQLITRAAGLGWSFLGIFVLVSVKCA
jgi:hypothetical protein